MTQKSSDVAKEGDALGHSYPPKVLRDRVDRMGAIRWDPRLLTGIVTLDDQHREVFRRVNAVIVALDEKQPPTFVKQYLFYMADYSLRHFSLEEEVMLTENYPHVERHRLIHKAFAEELFEVLEQYRVEGHPLVLALKLHTRFISWVRNHILTEDMELADYLRSRQNDP